MSEPDLVETLGECLGLAAYMTRRLRPDGQPNPHYS